MANKVRRCWYYWLLRLKILYKCIKANISAIWQHTLHIPPTAILISPNRSKKERKKEPHKTAYLSKNWALGKRSQENGPKAENDKTKSIRTKQKNKRGDIEKSDQTESSEIPDRGRHQKSPASFRGENKIKTSKKSDSDLHLTKRNIATPQTEEDRIFY